MQTFPFIVGVQEHFVVMSIVEEHFAVLLVVAEHYAILLAVASSKDSTKHVQQSMSTFATFKFLPRGCQSLSWV